MNAVVDAAHWWGPLGWLYRNTPGNLAASAISFAAGFAVARRHILRHVVGRLDHIIHHHPDIPEMDR